MTPELEQRISEQLQKAFHAAVTAPLLEISNAVKKELAKSSAKSRLTLKRLQSENLAIARENKALAESVTVALQNLGNTSQLQQDLVIAALAQDTEALKVWQELAAAGDTEALKLLEVCEHLTTLKARLEVHLDLVAKVLAELTLPEIVTAADFTPQQVQVRKSFPNAPPAHALERAPVSAYDSRRKPKT